jgi:hypothetical protein
MSIARTKQHLEQVMGDAENRVVALTGSWGAGKSHLWREFSQGSNDEAVKASLYVSLFGLRDLNQVKAKLMQGVFLDTKRNAAALEKLSALWDGGVKVLSSFHSGFAAMEGLPLLAAPTLLKGKVIVLDDIERKHDCLDIEEVLGMIDEFTQQNGCRFVLILNSDQLDKKDPWDVLREKVIDQELRLETTHAEAFEIAARLTPTPFGERISKALATCGVNNIRIARKVIRAVNRVLSSNAGLPAAVASRVVPSTVLLAALHYKGVSNGPDISFVLDTGTARDWSMSEPEDEGEAERISRWKRMMSELGIAGCDEYEALVVDYLQTGLFEAAELSTIIARYVDEEERMKAHERAREFADKAIWDHRISTTDLLIEANALIPIAYLLEPYTVTQLHETIAELSQGEGVAQRIVDAWIAEFRRAGQGEAVPDNPFGRRLHPDIQAQLDACAQNDRSAIDVTGAVLHIVEHSGWNAREEAALRSATAGDFELAIRTMEISKLKIFMRRMMDMAGQRATYDHHFPGAVDAFIAACKTIANDPQGDRLSALIKTLFKSKRSEGLIA